MIRISKLQKSYGSKIILKDVDFQFPVGERIALVGPNGVGKSTLLNILAKIEEADAGEILIPKSCKMAYLPQEPNPTPLATVLLECQAGRDDLLILKQKMHQSLVSLEQTHDANALAEYEKMEAIFKTEGGYSLESQAAGILFGLGFDEAKMNQSPLALSGGWRMRLELAKLFLRNADFLILDEPTNHLDLPSLMWVEDYLRKFKGTLLLVSHDRALLNRIPTHILFMHRGELLSYKGNYDAFVAAREQQQSYEDAASEQLRKKREQLESFVNRFGTKATKAKQAQSKMKQIARIMEEEQQFQSDFSESSIHFSLPIHSKGPKVPCEFQQGQIGYERPLASGIELKIDRGHKIAVIGANGIGKSTLIKTIAGVLNPLAGQINIAEGVATAYFSQDQLDTLDSEKDVISNLQMITDMGAGEARKILGSFLFPGDDVFKQVKVLSGGEKGRLGLACVMAKGANFLLLDEPTNHLDILSVEMLTCALQEYEGTTLFVSHDREFINSVCTHVFAMLPDGRSRLFEGNLADYERLAVVGNFPNVLEPVVDKSNETADRKSNNDSSNQEQDQYKVLIKELRKIEKEVKTLDANMERTRQNINQADQLLLSTDPNNFGEVNRIFSGKQNDESLLEKMEEQWLELSEREHEIIQAIENMGRKA